MEFIKKNLTKILVLLSILLLITCCNKGCENSKLKKDIKQLERVNDSLEKRGIEYQTKLDAQEVTINEQRKHTEDLKEVNIVKNQKEIAKANKDAAKSVENAERLKARSKK